jgi:hypothetical protein
MNILPADSLCNTKYSLNKLLPSTVVAVAAADLFFFDKEPGISVSIFGILLVSLLALNGDARRLTRKLGLTLIILFGFALFQSLIEFGFSNLVILISLALAITGEAFFAELAPAWQRWRQAMMAVLKAPTRWIWLFNQEPKCRNENSLPVLSSFKWGIRVLLPSMLICLPFLIFLANGNAIFANGVERACNSLSQILENFDFPSFGRMWFWLCSATLALALFAPSRTYRTSSLKPPRLLPAETLQLNYWRSLVILIATNLLFLAANSIDAIYLWNKAGLPSDVSYSEFVHDGTYNLIATVLLSATVLVFLFREAHGKTSPSLKILGITWIVQDLFLVSSVCLRLKLYVDAYDLSTLRIYLACFLLLVAVGFVLLAIYILTKNSFRWLLLSNALATFTLFYILQFTTVEPLVARYNVARWKENTTRKLDFEYLESLGPAAWPTIAELIKEPIFPGLEAKRIIDESVKKESTAQASRPWQSWQWRRNKFYEETLKIINQQEKKS